MDDFEELKPGESFVRHLIAGATAGTVEHCALFPIDTIKTVMQAAKPSATGGGTPHVGVISTTKLIWGRYGFFGMFRGVKAMAIGAAPAHAMHFSAYEFCKEKFGGNTPGHHPFATGLAGICATMVSDAILTPMDAVKSRLQLRARHYNGVLDCVRTIAKTEGPLALYASYTTTLVMNVPYHAIYFASYESLRRVFKKGKEHEFDPVAHLLAGGGAGSISAALTNPMDVAKTRLQTGFDAGNRYSGMVNALMTIWKEEGIRGYTRGIQPRIALHSVSASLCWLTYEMMKYLLNKFEIG